MQHGGLGAEELEALDELERAGVEWVEARAAGRDTKAADERWRLAMTVFRRAERRRRRAEKTRRQQWKAA